MNAHDLIDRIARALAESAAHGFDGADQDQAFLALPADWANRLQNQQCGLQLKALDKSTLSVSDPSGKYTVYLIVQLDAKK